MKNAKYYLLAAFAIVFVVPLSGLAQGQFDTTPPKLDGFSFSPTTVDVTNGAQTVTVEFVVSDDLSGASNIQASFRSPSGQVFRHVFASLQNGTPINGTWRGTFDLPRFSEAGAWQVNYVYLQDAVTNSQFINTADLVALGFPTALNVISTSDTTSPTLTSFSFSPTAINVSGGPQTVTFDIGAADSPAGLQFQPDPFCNGVVSLRSPSFRQSHFQYDCNFSLISGTSQNGVWRGAITLPRYSEAGTWKIAYVNIRDAAGNRLTLFTDELQARGFPVNLVVVSNPFDITPSQITSLTFTPKSINSTIGPNTIDVTLLARDNLAGVSYVLGDFFSPSGRQRQRFFASNLVAGTPQNGTWKTQFTMPQFSEGGTWQIRYLELFDAAANRISFTDPAQLRQMGVETDLEVFKPNPDSDGKIPPDGGTVTDDVFGDRAQITFPPGVLSNETEVAIDVLSGVNRPSPVGYQPGPASFFVNLEFNPPPPLPLRFPGMTLVLPLQTQMPPGTELDLYRVDPVTGNLVAAKNFSGQIVKGKVDPNGLSVTFKEISRLSIVVALIPTGQVLGDVNGDSVVNCADLEIVKASFGRRFFELGFDPRADINRDGVVKVDDLAFVSRRLPAGTICRVTASAKKALYPELFGLRRRDIKK